MGGKWRRVLAWGARSWREVRRWGSGGVLGPGAGGGGVRTVCPRSPESWGVGPRSCRRSCSRPCGPSCRRSAGSSHLDHPLTRQ
ncbi:hypothetical protein T261_4555 [Streptomyces lydicus]|nr:hypothetical protein T261_4555 [Streptomyces lydicus]